MPKFRVGVIERYERTYTVEAANENQALELVENLSPDDEGELFEYHSTASKDTWNVTQVREDLTN